MGFATVLSLCIVIGIPVGQALTHKAASGQEPEGRSGLLFCPLESDTLECLPACTEGSSAAPEPGGDAIDCLPVFPMAKAEGPMASEAPSVVQVDQKNRTVTLAYWSGRTGNSLKYLVETLYVAHMYNCSWAYFPEPPDPDRPQCQLKLLSVPRKVRVHLYSPALQSLRPLSGLGARARIPPLTRYASQALAEHYLRPLFNEATRAACAHAAADVGDAETLVVHLRSGDVLEDLRSATGHFAPCALASKIMAARGFKRAVLVTEPDLKHPCLKLIHNVTRVQSGSVPMDACTLMHARNLATMSRSTFSDTLDMFNPHLEEYHLPGPPNFRGCASAPPGGACPAASTASAKLFYYRIDGWSGFETAAEKMHYIAHANESSVELMAECPLASEAHLAN